MNLTEEEKDLVEETNLMTADSPNFRPKLIQTTSSNAFNYKKDLGEQLPPVKTKRGSRKQRYFRSISSPLCDKSGAKMEYFTRGDWFERKADLFASEILPAISKTKSKRKHKVALFWDYYFQLGGNRFHKSSNPKKLSKLIVKQGFGPWSVLWHSKEQIIRQNSPYSHFDSLKIRPLIAKGGDDLRQEQLALSLITLIKNVMKTEGVDVFIHNYDIIMHNSESGLIGKAPNFKKFNF